jgi:hypothetical protein
VSTEYKTVCDRVIAILEAERTDALSDDLTTGVTAIEKGQYVPTSSSAKPIVYVRLRRTGVIADLGGGQSRMERLMFAISGAARGDTQEEAQDEAMNLYNNIERVIANYPADSGYWGGSYFGWGYSGDDGRPEEFGEFEVDPGTDGAIVHFQMLWSCDVRIATDAL